jgi:hypothetical protein
LIPCKDPHSSFPRAQAARSIHILDVTSEGPVRSPPYPGRGCCPHCIRLKRFKTENAVVKDHATIITKKEEIVECMAATQWDTEICERSGRNEGRESERKEFAKREFLRLPEVIRHIASNRDVLCWNESHSFYEVLDGQRFEERFNALRCIRAKRNQDSIDRPFARMHVHFELVRGDKWAGTGSAFRPRFHSAGHPSSPCISKKANITTSMHEILHGDKSLRKSEQPGTLSRTASSSDSSEGTESAAEHRACSLMEVT